MSVTRVNLVSSIFSFGIVLGLLSPDVSVRNTLSSTLRLCWNGIVFADLRLAVFSLASDRLSKCSSLIELRRRWDSCDGMLTTMLGVGGGVEAIVRAAPFEAILRVACCSWRSSCSCCRFMLLKISLIELADGGDFVMEAVADAMEADGRFGRVVVVVNGDDEDDDDGGVYLMSLLRKLLKSDALCADDEECVGFGLIGLLANGVAYLGDRLDVGVGGVVPPWDLP